LRRPKQILALGGGMFSMEPENGLLDKYLLNLAMVEKPKICFFGTASNDGKEYIDMFYKFFREQNCIPMHLPLAETTKTLKEIEKIILEQDIIHVGGGNTKLIMETWKKLSVDKIMKKAWQRGVILSGMSAGAICWFEDGITNPNPGELDRLECVGLLKGSFCPHYDDRPELREVFKKLILEDVIDEGYGAEDGAALHFVDTKLLRIVSSRPGKTAFKVKKEKNKVIEEKLESIYLGKESDFKSVAVDKAKFDTIKTTYEFISVINSHDAKKVVEMISDNHLFIDSMGTIAKGKDTLLKAWKGYFDWFPDYEITLEHTYVDDTSIAIFGKASGTFDVNGKLLRENKFEMPAAWRAEVIDGKISLWQVYADNHPVWQIIERNEREPDGEILTKIKLLSAIEH
jgi:dipeptidase E